MGAAAVILQDATVQIREEGKEDQLVRRRRLKGTEMEETAEADFKTLSKPATHFGSRDEGSGGVSGSRLSIVDFWVRSLRCYWVLRRMRYFERQYG